MRRDPTMGEAATGASTPMARAYAAGRYGFTPNDR
jgi:hypothetical protein